MAFEHQYFLDCTDLNCVSIYKVYNFRGMRFFWMVQLDVSMLNIFPIPSERENLRVFQQHKDIKGGSRDNALHPSLHLTIFVRFNCITGIFMYFQWYKFTYNVYNIWFPSYPPYKNKTHVRKGIKTIPRLQEFYPSRLRAFGILWSATRYRYFVFFSETS